MNQQDWDGNAQQVAGMVAALGALAMKACPHCQIVGGHGAQCPTRLQTYEGRIRFVADAFEFPWRFECWKKCEALGISSEEFEAGVRLRTAEDEARRADIAWRGSPEYGRKP